MQKIIIGLAPNMTVEVSSDNIKLVIEQASFWSSLPSVCPVCQAPLVFFHRTPQDNEYFGQACTGPVRHESNFGQYKQTERGLYYKGDWQEAFGAYQPGEESPNGQQNLAPAPAPSANPVAQTLGDMVTAKQLGMIRALAREINMNEDEECKRLMSCGVAELSKRAASDFIEHLQSVQKVGFKVAPAPVPAAATQTLDPATNMTPVAPVLHGPECMCPNCDIPF